jgi:hypothetical protein
VNTGNNVTGIFDKSHPTLDLRPGPLLRLGMTFQAVCREGVTFNREIDMKTGWIHRMIGPYSIAGNTIYPSLGFHNAVLERINFAFTDEHLSLTDLRDLHDKFLHNAFGTPQSKDEYATRYVFGWGGISSAPDPHGGAAQIFMAFNP